MKTHVFIKNRRVSRDCHYWSTFCLENTEEIATPWINPGLSAEFKDRKERYFPKSHVERRSKIE